MSFGNGSDVHECEHRLRFKELHPARSILLLISPRLDVTYEGISPVDSQRMS